VTAATGFADETVSEPVDVSAGLLGAISSVETAGIAASVGVGTAAGETVPPAEDVFTLGSVFGEPVSRES
jgi:hypothetical protein